MGTKILLLYEYYVITASGMHVFFNILQEKFNGEIRALSVKEIRASDIEWADIVISIRGTCPMSKSIVKLCEKYHKIHILLIDDNLFAHQRQDWFMRQRQKNLQINLSQSSIVLTPNDYLTEVLSERAEILRKAHFDSSVPSDWIYPIKDGCESVSPFKIVYYCSDGSTNYFCAILRDVLPRLKEKTGREIQLSLVGIDALSDLQTDCEVRYIPHMGYADFRNHMRTQGYHLGIAPLVENDGFSKCKYFNKFIEFSMAGIPGIYSNCPPYTFVVRDKENGFLCGDSPEEWFSVITFAIKEDALRKECASNAQRQLKTEFSQEAVISALIKQIPELINYHAPQIKVRTIVFDRMKYYAFWTCEKINSAFIALTKDGIRGLMRRIQKYFSVMKNYKKYSKEN